MDEPREGPEISNEEFRMILQLETSLLIWLRTSLALMGFGFVITGTSACLLPKSPPRIKSRSTPPLADRHQHRYRHCPHRAGHRGHADFHAQPHADDGSAEASWRCLPAGR